MAKYLTKKKHFVTLLNTANSRKVGINEYRQNGINIVEIPDLLFGRLRSGWDLWSALNRTVYLMKNSNKFDIIHLFESRPATIHPIQIYRIFNRIPLIIDWVDWIGRGGILEVIRPKWYKYLFGNIETFYEEYFKKKAQGVTAICSKLRDRAINLGIDNCNILVLPVGVDNDIYKKKYSSNFAKKYLQLPFKKK